MIPKDYRTLRISELEIGALTEEDIRDIVMTDVREIEKDVEIPDTPEKEMVIILGATPGPIRERVKKALEVVDNRHSRTLLLSGGKGWHRRYSKEKPDDPRDPEELAEKKRYYLEIIREIISPELLGRAQNQKERELYQIVSSELEKMGDHRHRQRYEERIDDKDVGMTEARIMELLIKSMGEPEGVNIIHEPLSKTTPENAIHAAKILRDRNYRCRSGAGKDGEEEITRVVLVTAPEHCQRSKLTFRRYFSDEMAPIRKEYPHNNISLDNIQILACPSTDPSKTAFSLIKSECQRMISYSRTREGENGRILLPDVYDIPLVELVGQEKAKRIFEHMSRFLDTKKEGQQSEIE